MFFASFFYVHINMAFCFYIYCSLQVLSCDSWHSFDVIVKRLVQIKKIVYPHTLWCLIDLKVKWYKGRHFFHYLTKRKCEFRYKIKWKSWIQFMWHLTWQYLQKRQFWILILHCLMKRDSVNRMFPFAKWDINRCSRYEPKNN